MSVETEGRILSTVYFGGGTPSLMDPDIVAAILDRARARWPTANDAEITLEANPSSVEAGRFGGYRDAGVNRVSIGVQALNDADLKKLGRLHDVRAARAALETAKSIFSSVNFDLIYARQDQSLSEWREELSEAVSLAADHLSLYQLTVEPGTAFGDRLAAGRLLGLPDEARAADMYDATQEICEAAGLPAYEVSNHAREGSASRHNLIYWRQGDYLGIGPGAHGRITLGAQRVSTETVLAPGHWLKAVEETGSGEVSRNDIPAVEWADEYVMMSLRLSEGLDVGRYRAIGGKELPENRVTDLIDLGFLKKDGNRLYATESGRPVLNAVLRELMVGS